MGLDMYLTKKHYVKNWDWEENPEKKYDVDVKRGGKTIPHIKKERISYIEEEVMYWRKANAIHKWFVDQVQDGEDNCGTYYVSTETLEELRTICEKTLEVINKSNIKFAEVHTGCDQNGNTYATIPTYDCEDELGDLLMPQSGFFFGSTEIDEYYKETIQETLNFLNEELKTDDGGDYYYHSSW